MALQTSGAISLSNVQSEFGGSNPIGINEYYRGGSNVPNSTANNSIPTSGQIQLDDFYGGTASSSDNTFNFTMDSGSTGGKISFSVVGADSNQSYLNNISNGAIITNNLAVSLTIEAFSLTQGLSSGVIMRTNSSTGGDDLWTTGNVRGFTLQGTSYSFVQPATGSNSIQTANGNIGSGSTTAIETQMTNLVGTAVTVTLTY